MTRIPTADALGFDAIEIGNEFALERCFTQEEVQRFAELSGDFSPLHVDSDYAAQTEFGRCVVHGMLLASLFSQLVGMRIPGRPALYLGQDLTFRRTVLVGEAVRAQAKVTGKTEATRSILLATEIRTADGKVAVSGTAKVKVREDQQVCPSDAETVPASPIVGGRVAVIAGGTGGIGAGVARSLLRRGYAVALLYHANRSRADRVVAELGVGGGRAHAVQADVTDPAVVASALARVADTLGEPRVVVNAATGPIGQRPTLELESADFQRHLDIQVHGVLGVCRAAHPYLKRAGGGSIVNIASQVTGDVPPPRMADYVTAKYALVGLSKALAIEWADDGIRVNLVSPGLMQTELTEYYHDRLFKIEASRTPLKRLATPEDVGNAVAFLVDEQSSFLTGAHLFLTGGQTML